MGEKKACITLMRWLRVSPKRTKLLSDHPIVLDFETYVVSVLTRCKIDILIKASRDSLVCS